MKYVLTICLLFAVCFTLILSSCEQAQDAAVDQRIRVILDTDCNNELDDQHALAYMVFNGDVFDVEGITVNNTRAGGGIDGHYNEAVRVLKLCSLHPQITVYKGATASYDEIVDDIGNPGFDGSEAVDFIIRQAKMKSDRPLVLLPVGKLTNIALAIKKDPSIIPNIRVVWLGANYPEPGEYNLENDITAVNPVIDSGVRFEIAIVRYGKPSGTDAVKASIAEIKRIMPGKGPVLSTAIEGRHGGTFTNFGDYSVDLFVNYKQESRPLFDMAAVAIVKNGGWADRVELPAPKLVGNGWEDRPENPHKIVIWENFDRDGIMTDFYDRMENYVLAE
ncbi:nucleoside hydrolase [Candidatus Latescibacterota bacterium]